MEKTVARRVRRDKSTGTAVPKNSKPPLVHNVVRGPALAELLALGNLDERFAALLLKNGANS